MRIFQLFYLSLATVLVVPAAIAQGVAGFGTCSPRIQKRPGAVGCFIITDQPVGKFNARPVYWHISRFPTRKSATRARPANGTVVEAYDHIWLMDFADATWRAPGGKEVARIGPLPVDTATSYSALYMEATMRPGMKSAIHRHSGPEMWYTMSGETCLETPNGATLGRAGGRPVIIPGDLPMELTATGHTLRRSLVLILHDSQKPPTAMESRWKPAGKCK
ncbi:MAG TPA: hypothetical protein VGD02_06080 [Gemmatimonadaceae bacterium]